MARMGHVIINGQTEYYESYSMDEIRYMRNAQLVSSDWAMSMVDRWNEEELEAIKAYRQALRDLPDVYPDPDAARDNWPDEPECIVYGVDGQ